MSINTLHKGDDDDDDDENNNSVTELSGKASPFFFCIEL